MSIGRSQRQERTKRISSNPKPQQGKATETNKRTNKQSIRYMKNNTIQQQQQQQQRRRLIFRAEWTALNFCFSIDQL